MPMMENLFSHLKANYGKLPLQKTKNIYLEMMKDKSCQKWGHVVSINVLRASSFTFQFANFFNRISLDFAFILITQWTFSYNHNKNNLDYRDIIKLTQIKTIDSCKCKISDNLSSETTCNATQNSFIPFSISFGSSISTEVCSLGDTKAPERKLQEINWLYERCITL